MMYRHTKRCQALLRKAVRDMGLGLEEVIREAGLTCSVSTLDRFLTASGLDEWLRGPKSSPSAPIEQLKEGFLNLSNAERLWSYLNANRQLQKTMELLNLTPDLFIAVREVASAMECRYNTVNAGRYENVCREYMCYKRSTQFSGHIVKSLFVIQHRAGSFEFQEHQRWTGRHTRQQGQLSERTDGFGFVKGKTMWLIGRQVKTDEPRMFAFFDIETISLDDDDEKPHILYGHLMEGTEGRRSGDFFGGFVLLQSVQYEEHMWRREARKEPYDKADQVDIYPVDARDRKLKKNLDLQAAALSSDITRYIVEGRRVGEA